MPWSSCRGKPSAYMRRRNALQIMNSCLVDMAEDDSLYASLFGEGFTKERDYEWIRQERVPPQGSFSDQRGEQPRLQLQGSRRKRLPRSQSRYYTLPVPAPIPACISRTRKISWDRPNSLNAAQSKILPDLMQCPIITNLTQMGVTNVTQRVATNYSPIAGRLHLPGERDQPPHKKDVEKIPGFHTRRR